MTTCTARIGIQRAPEAVAGYVSQVPNLPSWTAFFRSVGASADGRRFPVVTAMGELVTWIESGRTEGGTTECSIHSLIGGREEQALLRVRKASDGSGSAVEFTVQLPADAPAERAAGQRAAMAEELERLRDLLESSG